MDGARTPHRSPPRPRCRCSPSTRCTSSSAGRAAAPPPVRPHLRPPDQSRQRHLPVLRPLPPLYPVPTFPPFTTSKPSVPHCLTLLTIWTSNFVLLSSFSCLVCLWLCLSPSCILYYYVNLLLMLCSYNYFIKLYYTLLQLPLVTFVYTNLKILFQLLLEQNITLKYILQVHLFCTDNVHRYSSQLPCTAVRPFCEKLLLAALMLAGHKK